MKETIEQTEAPENRREAGKRSPIRGGEAYRFRPGQSGNPGGRPESGSLARACRDLLGVANGQTYAEAIAEKLGEFARKGHLPSIRELADRAEGRAGQSIEIEACQTHVPTEESKLANSKDPPEFELNSGADD